MKTYKIEIADHQEIDDVINECTEQENKGGSRWPGMTYEQGVLAAIRWLIGETEDHPLDE